MRALKPESFRPSNAWSDRFFRCLRTSGARPSLEKTAQGVADGLGEGLGLAFLFASFSLTSKEKEEPFPLTEGHVVSFLYLVYPSAPGLRILSITEMDVRMCLHVIASSFFHKVVLEEAQK